MNGTMQEVQPRGSASTLKWSLATSIGSIVTAFVASLCCVGPLVFAVLGIGGAGLLIKFEPYRPYFTVLTLGVLAAGFYFNYRKPKAATSVPVGADCACEYPNANKTGRMMLWIATILVTGLLGFPYVAARLFG